MFVLIMGNMIALDNIKVLHPVVIEIIRISLPNLISKSPNDLLEIREKLKRYIEPFHVELNKLASKLCLDISDDELKQESQIIVDRDIAPIVAELRRFLENPGRIFLKHLISVSPSITTGTVTLIGAFIAGIPKETLILGSPFIQAFGAGLKTLYERSEKKFSNPFTFLLLANKKLSK